MPTLAVVRHNFSHNGFSVLTTLLIGIAVMTVIMSVYAAVNISFGTNTLFAYRGQELKVFLSGCQDDALIRLRRSAVDSSTTLVSNDGTLSCLMTTTAAPQPSVWTIIIFGIMNRESPEMTITQTLSVRRTGQSVRVISTQVE